MCHSFSELVSSPHSVRDALDSEISHIRAHLVNCLPFSINMIAAIRDHYDRCRVLVAGDVEDIAGVLVEFHSMYNGHIWYDPIIWITGSPDISSKLLHERGYGRSIVISQTDFSSQFPLKTRGMRVFEEFIMTVNTDMLPVSASNPNVEIRQLNTADVEGSLLFSGYDGENMDLKERKQEENFLKERICLGLYSNGQLVSRGAIMSVTEDYASVGAFFTLAGARKKGFGSSIVAEVSRKAATTSKYACLFVRSTNNEAISLYKKLGFKITGKAYFLDLGTGLSP